MMNDASEREPSSLFVAAVARWPWAAILLGITLVLGLGAGMKHLRADFTHKGFFSSDDPMLLRLEAFERRFGNDEAILLAVRSPSGIFDADSAALVRELTDKMWQVPEVIRVESLATFNWVHGGGDDIVVEPLLPASATPQLLEARKRVALAHEVLPGYLIDKDATVTAIIGWIKPGLDAPPNAPAITRPVLEMARLARRGDHEAHVTGNPAATFAFEEVTKADMQRLAPLALGIAALFLALLLRSLVGVLLPFVAVIGAVIAAFGFAGWAGLHQTAASSTIPSTLIAIGIADTLHILVSYFEERRRGQGRKLAARLALDRNLLGTLITTVTTAIAFFSFVSASLKPIVVVGLMTGVGALVTWLVAQLVVGGLLFVIPIRVKPVPVERMATAHRRSGQLVDWIVRHRVAILVASAGVSVASLLVALRLEVNSDPIKYFRQGTPARTANEFLHDTMGNARSFELVVSTGVADGVKDPALLAKVDDYQRWLQAQPGMTRAVSILDPLKATHRALNGDRPEAYRLAGDRETIAQELLLYTMGLPQGMDLNDRLTVNNDALRITVFNRIANSRESVAAIEAVVAEGKRRGLDVEATGKYYLYQHANGYVVRSFLTSLWSASLLIGILMMFFLRSVRLGLVSMLPNLVPLLAGGALLRLMNQPLDMGTALVASVCLGISIDDTAHVLATFAAKRRRGLAPNDALRATLSQTAPALLAINGILILTFGSFATATLLPNINFGILTAAILTFALVADMLLTPALLVSAPVRAHAAAPTLRSGLA
jgi:uncharacterized protein